MYALRLTSDDIARVRFAVSPLWEVCHAVRALVDTRQHPYHLPWLDQVRPQIAGLGQREVGGSRARRDRGRRIRRRVAACNQQGDRDEGHGKLQTAAIVAN